MNQGIHVIDILQWYMGPVESVYGQAHTLSRDIEVEDTAAAVLKFSSGALGVIEAATSVYPETIPHRIEIHGEKGSICTEGEKVVRWEVIGEDGNALNKLGAIKIKPQKPVKTPDYSSMEGHRRQIIDLIESIRTGRDPLVTGEEGRKSLEIILAIYESSKKGMPVKLPLKERTL